jgi:hypothetical protein
MKLCKDCKHFQANGAMLEIGYCAAPLNLKTSPVSGDVSIGRTGYRYAETLRQAASFGVLCGPDARWHEPKTPAAEPVEPAAEKGGSRWRFWA